MNESGFKSSIPTVRLWPKYALLAVYSLFLLVCCYAAIEIVIRPRNTVHPVFDLWSGVTAAVSLVPLSALVFGLARAKWWTPIVHGVTVSCWILMIGAFAHAMVPSLIASGDSPRLLLYTSFFVLPILSHVYILTHRSTLFRETTASWWQKATVWIVSILWMVGLFYCFENTFAALDLQI